jgi:dihydroorotase
MSRRRPASPGWPSHGTTRLAGQPANLTLVDPARRWTVDPARSASRSRNTPVRGHDAAAPVVATFLRGGPTVLGRARR